MRLLGISGSPSKGSRTSGVLQAVLETAGREPGVDVELLEVAQRHVVFCDGRSPGAYVGDTRRTIDLVVAADAYVVGSPAYRGSYTGILKNLFDLLPNDALRHKPVGLVATAGSDHHFLMLEHQLRPLLTFFQAFTVPGTVFAHNAHFEGNRLVDEGVRAQCGDLGLAIVRLAGVLPRNECGPSYPTITRKLGQQP